MPFWKVIPKSRQCDICLTAYAFFILEGHCKGSFQVILSTWISLGSCRYSFSPAWLISSWLSKGHTWIRVSTIPRPPRPFHNDYSDFYTGEDLTQAAILKRRDILRPFNILSRLRLSQSEEPEHELLRTESITSTINGERSRDREMANAAQTISVQVEKQVKPSRTISVLKTRIKQIWKHIENRKARRERRSQNIAEMIVWRRGS